MFDEVAAGRSSAAAGDVFEMASSGFLAKCAFILRLFLTPPPEVTEELSGYEYVVNVTGHANTVRDGYSFSNRAAAPW
jgi:hypothetical protein